MAFFRMRSIGALCHYPHTSLRAIQNGIRFYPYKPGVLFIGHRQKE